MIEKIELGGKLRGIKFTMLSMEKFEEKVPFTKKSGNARIIYATFWAGLNGYTSAKEEEEDYTYEDVQEWVDKLYMDGKTDVITKVCDAWAAADVFKSRLKEIENWTDKIRSLVPEQDEVPKKKAKSTTSGLKRTNSPLVH